jgi:hypothetical protein
MAQSVDLGDISPRRAAEEKNLGRVLQIRNQGSGRWASDAGGISTSGAQTALIYALMATKRFNDPIEPMTLQNMRENGVRSLAVQCHQCLHEVIMNVDHLPGGLTVPSFGPKMVCTKCGTIGADVRPNWRERGT